MNFVSDGSIKKIALLQLNAFKAWRVDTPVLTLEGIQVRFNLRIGTILNCLAIVNQ